MKLMVKIRTDVSVVKKFGLGIIFHLKGRISFGFALGVWNVA